MNYMDIRESYYALFLSIVKNMSVDQSLGAICGRAKADKEVYKC